MIARRAYKEDLGWGLTKEEWSRIDGALDALNLGTDRRQRETAEMILVGLHVGTSADKVARVTGLNRDKFIRPRAQRLRENGCWINGKTALNLDSDSLHIDILLLVLAAEGLIESTST